MYRQLSIALGGLVAVAGCAHRAQISAAGEVAPAVPATSNYLPVGTSFNVRLNQTLGSSSSRSGDSFTATVIDPVIAQNGMTAVPAGSVLSGTITGLHHPSFPGEQAVIRLDFNNLRMRGVNYPFDGSIANVAVENQSTSPSSSSITRGAVTGAAAGAVLGGIIGGVELSKIITGGLLGAAAGTVISLSTGSTESVIPAGSTMTVRSTTPIQVR